jgi:predicted dehydrogenase
LLEQEKKLGVAVVGLGVGEQHAQAFLSTGKCELKWLYDLNGDKTQAVIETLGIGQVAPDFRAILEDAEVDVVSVASFDDAHFEQVAAALHAGKHVFVEKPLCRTTSELQAIKQAWSSHQGRLKLASNLVLRAAPIYQWLRKKIGDGDLGGIYAFDSDYLYGRLHKITQGWRKKVNNYSVMLGGGIHLIDLLVWLTGNRPATVSAIGNRICTENTEFHHNDYVAATLYHNSGLISRISANFGCVHRHQHVVRIFGTMGTFIYDDSGPRLHLSRDGAIQASPLNLPALPETKGELIPKFVAAILKNEDLNGHTQALFDVISICAACDEASQKDTTVEVQYV